MSRLELYWSADRKSWIPLKRAAKFFFREPFLSKRYKLGVCHGWVHLHGLNRPARSANREIQNENSCPQRDSNPGTFAYEATSLSVALLVEICMELLKFDCVLLERDIKIDLYRAPRSRCSKIIRRVFLSYNIRIVFLFDLFRRLLTVKS